MAEVTDDLDKIPSATVIFSTSLNEKAVFEYAAKAEAILQGLGFSIAKLWSDGD
jgi:hypothetical protein